MYVVIEAADRCVDVVDGHLVSRGRTTKFTRRARETLNSEPTLPPARVQRLVHVFGRSLKSSATCSISPVSWSHQYIEC